ncbi:hypothetical protein A8H31_00990 [Burkholderia thailandensis]|nr:hypothetical protein A8H31_00990 [Burkholderia thailandensis]
MVADSAAAAQMRRPRGARAVRVQPIARACSRTCERAGGQRAAARIGREARTRRAACPRRRQAHSRRSRIARPRQDAYARRIDDIPCNDRRHRSTSGNASCCRRGDAFAIPCGIDAKRASKPAQIATIRDESR